MSTKNKIESVFIVILFWLIALALVYLVFIKFRFLLHQN